MRSAFGQTRSAIGQMCARLAKRARNLPNVAHLVKCRAFDQLVKCAARLPKCTDWSNVPYSDTVMYHACVVLLLLDLYEHKTNLEKALKIAEEENEKSKDGMYIYS